jgi:CBS domain-containing protein
MREAARAMRDSDIGDVIVMEHNQVCGIITDRDIAFNIKLKKSRVFLGTPFLS